MAVPMVPYNLVVPLKSQADFEEAVLALMTCEHSHHFGAEKDSQLVLTSELGMECIKKALGL